jgi:tRNA (mo5U34)-methyltransferase
LALELRPELTAEVERLAPWFHNLHLPDGVQTAPHHPLGDFPRRKWARVSRSLPADLTGWNVLDIGCNAGFYTFELARRGAFVTAMDHDRHYLRQARWAAGVLGLEDRTEFELRGVYDLAREQRTFDLVLFLGVFYHLRYPLLALDLVAERVRRLLLFQTLTMPGLNVLPRNDALGINNRTELSRAGWPKLAFIEGRFENDATNWWAPNHAAVEAMLRSTGLRVVGRPGHEFYLCEPPAGGAVRAREWDQAELAAASGREPGATRSPEFQQ